MNRATFLKTLAGSAVALPVAALANPTQESAIYDLLDAMWEAQFDYDFPRLASMMHPASLRLFRRHLSFCYERLLSSCPPGKVAEVSGFSTHPKDITASDADFFVLACNEAKARHPEFVGNPGVLPFRIHGTVFDDERSAHILYSHRGVAHTERTSLAFASPHVLSVRKDSDRWQIQCGILAPSIVTHWWCNLAGSFPGDAAAVKRFLMVYQTMPE